MEKVAVVTDGSHISIQVRAVRRMGKKGDGAHGANGEQDGVCWEKVDWN